MSTQILLCTDLDRTLLPNGPQPESPLARPLLRTVARRPEITLAYVSGRHKQLLLEAIREYDLPVPDYAIGDVGTTLYEIRDGDWHPSEAWYQEIAPDWGGHDHEELARLLDDLPELRRQEPEKQNVFKLSYYAPADEPPERLLNAVRQRLMPTAVRASLIWSVDEMADLGLLDILPESATKRHAIEFLMQLRGVAERDLVFAGDSGNDLPVLTSGLQAVLVRNAQEQVRRDAVRQVEAAGRRERLYLARGGFLGMNGNYAAGVLEGLAHFVPRTRDWMIEAAPSAAP